MLFIGGTGIISTACVHLAVERGHDVWLLNRGQTAGAGVPEGIGRLTVDVTDAAAARSALAGHAFDAVVQWVGFTPDQIERDLTLFADAGQYVFISSATVYRKPLAHYRITESAALGNPLWPYAHDKVRCEDRLRRAYAETGFPMTIVRPSLTYGRTHVPTALASWSRPYTVIDRMRRGAAVIVPGDGTSLWTMTHNSDFAVGLLGLLGQPGAVGEAFHITSDEVLTWDAVHAEIAAAAGVEANLVHVPSDGLIAADPELAGPLLGDTAHSLVFDNAKVRALVPEFDPVTPFARGIRDTVAWLDADPARQGIDAEANAFWDRVASIYSDALKVARG
jgi:nucleoside-diphosphate-sugar epimerase